MHSEYVQHPPTLALMEIAWQQHRPSPSARNGLQRQKSIVNM